MRTTTYTVLSSILKLIGPSLRKEDLTYLAPLVKGYCEDLLPTEQEGTYSLVAKANGLSANSGISVQTEKAQRSHPTLLYDLESAATALLPVFIAKVNPAYIPHKFRVQLERASILTRNKKALVACVLNPAKKDTAGGLQASLLPLLAREFSDSPEVEALLRPRMPIIQMRVTENGEDLVNGYEQERLEDDDPANELNGHNDMYSIDEEARMADFVDSDVEMNTLKTAAPTRADADSTAGEGGIAIEQDEEDDLYSATPKPGAEPPEDEVVSGSTKRPASETLSPISTSAKRLHGTPITEALAEGSSMTFPGPDPSSVATQLPVTTAINDPSDAHERAVITLPSEGSRSSIPGQVASAVDINSDESDFEMPPLTLEPDTDPDDEEQEDE